MLLKGPVYMELAVFSLNFNSAGKVIFSILVNFQAVAGGMKCCFCGKFYQLPPDKDNTEVADPRQVR